MKRNYSIVRLPVTARPDLELNPEVKTFLEDLGLSVRAYLCTERAIRQLHLHTVEAATFYLQGVAAEKMPCPNAGSRTRQELREKLSYNG
jgi:hypothetical protein